MTVLRTWVLVGIGCLCGFAQVPDSRLLQKYFDDGENALARHNYADAETAYRNLARLDPRSAEVHAKLGMIYVEERKFEEATESLQEALKLKPKLPGANVFLSISQSELGEFHEALRGLEDGFRHSVDPVLKRMCGLQLERAYTGLRMDKKAIEVAIELNSLYPDDAEILYHAARLYGSFAYLTMQHLAEVAPSSVWRRQAAAEAYESQGSYDLAVVEYREALALDPNRPGIHYRLGRVFLARSLQSDSSAEAAQDANREFAEELKRDPTNANAAYELGEADRKSGKLDVARDYFELAVKHDPDFEEAQVGLARTLIALAKPELALPHLQTAVKLNPRSAVTYYHLATVQSALGNVAEQQKALAEYRRLNSVKAMQESKELLPAREVTKQDVDSK